MKRFLTKKEKGFSFLEVIVATFIFSLIMVSASASFGKFFTAYRTTRAVQRDLENAQFAMNAIAKTLRTSTVITSITPAPTNLIRVFDHSQDSLNPCMEFRFDVATGSLQSRNTESVVDVAACQVYTFSNNFADMTTGYVTGNFSGAQSTSGLAGKVTISAEVCPSSPCPGNPRDRARIQTTVSLRNE